MSGSSAGKSRAIRPVVWVLGLLLLTASAAAYFWLRPPALEALYPRIGPAITAVYGSGSVEASVMLPVAPRVGGRLVMLASDEHNQVRKGEVLGRLEDVDLTSNIAQLQANADFALADMQRGARLWAQNAIAQQVYERAIAVWKAADAAVRQARAQAGYMTLKAPDNCLVIQRDGEVGQYIAANTPIFWLSCHAQLRISALVDEEDVALVKPGQPVLIRADAFPNEIFHAQVTEVTPKGDPIGRSYRVRILLPRNTPLQIGMTTESNIIVRREDHALLLPAQAVAGDQVWTIRNGKAQRLRVTLGAKANDWVQVRSGLSAQDLVLRDANARPGDKPRLRIAAP